MAYYKLITTVHNSESIISDAATLLPYCKSIQVRFGEKLEDADKTYLTFSWFSDYYFPQYKNMRNF